MNISIGSDHAGYDLKEVLKDHLQSTGHTIIDVGCFSPDSVDYPDFGHAAAKKVINHEAEYGVLVCGSGIGISIAANKVIGVRAANCTSVEMAQLSRQHNNANIVAVGSRLMSEDLAKEIVDAFLTTEFEGGRHERRVNKIELEAQS